MTLLLSEKYPLGIILYIVMFPDIYREMNFNRIHLVELVGV